MKSDSEVTELPKVAWRMLDWANGNPCQSQFRAIAIEYFCGLLIGGRLTASRCRENTRPCQRQTLLETLSGDGKRVYLCIVDRKYADCLKFQREYKVVCESRSCLDFS